MKDTTATAQRGGAEPSHVHMNGTKDTISVHQPDPSVKTIVLPSGHLVLVDAWAYHRFALGGYYWCLIGKGYAATKLNGHFIPIHRYLMDPPPGLLVDHVNLNKLDNRYANLRLCTSAQNKTNQKAHQDSTSPYKGVAWNANKTRWRASITVNYRRISLGSFIDARDAARAYNVAAIHHYGEFARLNEVD